jgi:hypothetical protein
MAGMWKKIGDACIAGSFAVLAAPVVIGALGFTAGGVLSGSCAAGVQAMIGNVAAGSLFATLQSAGVLGLSTAAMTALFTTTAGLTLLVGHLASRVPEIKDLNPDQQKAVGEAVRRIFEHNRDMLLCGPVEQLTSNPVFQDECRKLLNCGVPDGTLLKAALCFRGNLVSGDS